MFWMSDVVCFSQRDPFAVGLTLLVLVFALLGVSKMVTMLRGG
jgi:hypothetical protein